MHKDPITAKQGCSVLAERIYEVLEPELVFISEAQTPHTETQQGDSSNPHGPSSYRNNIKRRGQALQQEEEPKAHSAAIKLNSFAHLQCHLLEGELLVVGLDAAHVVRGGGVQGLHQQVQGVAELKDKTTRLEEGWRCRNPASRCHKPPVGVTQREPPHRPRTRQGEFREDTGGLRASSSKRFMGNKAWDSAQLDL